MDKQEKTSGKVTKANYITILGLVALFVCILLGQLFKRGGEIQTSVIIGVISVIIAVVLIVLMTKAKVASNDLKKWMVLEKIVAVVYIIFAYFTIESGGIMYTFAVIDNKESLKDKAKNDIEKISGMLNRYEAFEKDAIIVTKEGLKASIGKKRTDTLKNFIKYNIIRSGTLNFDTMSIYAFVEEIEREKLLGVKHEKFKKEFTDKINEMNSSVEEWKFINIPLMPKKIENVATETGNHFTELSKGAKLPLIKKERYIDDIYYTISSNQDTVFSIDVGVESLELKKSISEVTGFSLTGLLIGILIHLLILLSYFAAYRTTVVRNKHMLDDGGIIL